MPRYERIARDDIINSQSQEQTPLMLNPCQQTPLIVNLRTIAREDSAPGLAALRAEIRELEVKETELITILDDMNRTFARRRAPLEDERKRIVREKKKLHETLLIKMAPPSLYPPAPGPSELKFVDSDWFSTVCNLVVVCNLLSMLFAKKLQAYHLLLYVADQVFLLWYVFELIAKWRYHRCNLFRGKVQVVWWNWLDAGIVFSGIVDQWVMPMLKDLIPLELPANCNATKALRLLRLFRIMRFLKVIKAFVHADMSWTEKEPFQIFMSAVIAVNSVVLALELDLDWGGWIWFEQIFLAIYLFELLVRLKFFGWHFFVNSDFAWNNLDFTMVCGGVFELWLMPAWTLIQMQLYGEARQQNTSFAKILKMLKMMKIIRVLRLVRLLRMVRPLYTLLMGVMEALAAMQWVMVLTLLVLYAGAIVFTSLIGHGMIYDRGDAVPPEAETSFGSVSSSFFSLFKLMNGDTSVVEPITKDPRGQLLFAAFMVLSNWAVLAILTSVVSDNMMSASNRVVEEDREKQEEERLEARKLRLTTFFGKMDSNSSGSINKSEWEAMLANSELREELRDISGLEENTLRDVFSCLSEEDEDVGEYLLHDDFIAHLNHDKDVADRRQVLHLAHLMKELEKITLHKVSQLEHMAEDRFKALEGMLEKVILPVPQGPSVANEVEKTTLSKIEKLEDATQHKLEVFEGMLTKVLVAVNQRSPQEARPLRL